jgi:hypothetical protein
LVDRFLEDHDIGRAVTNDSGVVTERNPDTVRGADVMYHSYHQRMPADMEPEDYPEVPPEIIWEVLSPNDRRQKVLARSRSTWRRACWSSASSTPSGSAW